MIGVCFVILCACACVWFVVGLCGVCIAFVCGAFIFCQVYIFEMCVQVVIFVLFN